MLLFDFSCNTPKMTTFQNSTEQVFLGSHLLCWLPALSPLSLPLSVCFPHPPLNLLHEKKLTHSSSTFLQHSKEEEPFSSFLIPQSITKYWECGNRHGFLYLCAFILFSIHVSCVFRLSKFGKHNFSYWIFVQFYNLFSHLGLLSTVFLGKL